VSDLRAERARRILLHTMRADSPAISALCEAFGSSGALWRQRRLTINPVVRLSGTWDDFLRGRPKRLRQELRTTQNHLGRGGEWSFEEATQADAAHEIYDALVELHTSRQEGKPGSSVFGELRRRSFLKSIIGELSPTVETHLSAIRWQGRIVSAAYSLQCGDTFFYWTPSFDPNLRSMSLGKLHVAKLIQSCFGRSLKVFDFMGGDEPYKVQWTSQALDILNIDVYAGHLGYWCADAAAWGFNTARVIKRKSKLLGRAWTAASKVGSR
jgi:CelD/BcsL family acetyltransferase involved in cellulose biosynthesis